MLAPTARSNISWTCTRTMATPLAGGATDPRLQPTTAAPAAPVAAIPSRGAPQPPLGPAPGTVQSNVGGVRGQQPGAGGPIITTGQFGQQQIQPQPQPQAPAAPPAPAIPTRTGDITAPLPPPDPRHGLKATTKFHLVIALYPLRVPRRP